MWRCARGIVAGEDARRSPCTPAPPLLSLPMPAQPPFTASAWFPRAGNQANNQPVPRSTDVCDAGFNTFFMRNAELRGQFLDNIPVGHFSKSAEIPKLALYLCSEDSGSSPAPAWSLTTAGQRSEARGTPGSEYPSVIVSLMWPRRLGCPRCPWKESLFQRNEKTDGAPDDKGP